MATWPSSLPLPSPSGYSANPKDTVLRSDMESGASRSRNASRVISDQISLTWEMSDVQYAAFKAWYFSGSGANGGAAFFTGLNLPLGSGGLTAVTAKFSSQYTAEYLPVMYWKVTARLEIR